ncbi:MAG: methyltransferase domain-containing protein [Candidatus Korobacteraceae bacterium]
MTPVEHIPVQEDQSFEAIMKRIRAKLKDPHLGTAVPARLSDTAELLEHIRLQLGSQDFSQIRMQMDAALKAATKAHNQVGELNPRLPGLHNNAVQFMKKAMRRSLTWYTRPLQAFQEAILRALRDIAKALQVHDSDLRTHAAAIQDVRDRSALLTHQVATLQSALRGGGDYSLETAKQAADPAGEQPCRSRLLKENDVIIEYWDHAARTNPMRETVTPDTGQSEEQYLQEWVKVGEYVAGKIMSYAPPNPVALEIGPGMGRITIPMSRYCRSIMALDISPEMARQARQTLACLPNLEVKVITDEDLSFLPNEHFDLAYSIACFQHADKKSFYRYLRGMRRAIKPGGVLFFGVMNLCSERGWEHFAAIVESDYPEFFHTPDEVACYLTHAGFSSHKLDYEGETLWAIAQR